MKVYVNGTIHSGTRSVDFILAELGKAFQWTTLAVSSDLNEFVDGTPVEIYEQYQRQSNAEADITS